MSKKSSGKRWRDAFDPSETMQRIRPMGTSEFINNPHCGFATFQRFNGDPLEKDTGWHDEAGPVTFTKKVPKKLTVARYLPTRIAYCRWPWSVLEPKKGKLRYDIIEGSLDSAARRGQTLQVRTQPFVHADLPQWFVDTGAPCTERPSHGGIVREPDANHPLYIKHWSEHILALGKRFDGHPALESMDVAYAGPFGEMGGNASPASSAKLVDAYLRAFRKTQLLSMISTHGCRYAASTGKAIGWRADGYMDPKNSGHGMIPDHLCWNHMWDVYPVDIFTYGIADAWKTAPVTLEPHATMVHCQQNGWDIDWLFEHGLKYHPTVFMHKSVYIPTEWMDKTIAFVKRLGYRFNLHQMVLPLEARPGQRIPVNATIDNKGVAPIYRPYRFALRFSQGRQHAVVPLAVDIRKWMPDYSYFAENFTFPKTLHTGEVKVSCAIIDDAGKPFVRLAMRDIDKDGWHPLTNMDVVK